MKTSAQVRCYSRARRCHARIGTNPVKIRADPCDPWTGSLEGDLHAELELPRVGRGRRDPGLLEVVVHVDDVDAVEEVEALGDQLEPDRLVERDVAREPDVDARVARAQARRAAEAPDLALARQIER